MQTIFTDKKENKALPYQVFTTEQVKSLENIHAQGHNGHCYDLMERAGQRVFAEILNLNEKPSMVWVFCGRGNNGGDGYIVASLLKEHGIAHRVFAMGEPHPNSEAKLAFEYYLSQGGNIEFVLPENFTVPPEITVDAILGTGIKSAPKEDAAEWILFVNDLGGFKISIDIPSGVIANTGMVPGNCINADLTVCMLGLKPGLFTSDAVDYTGRVVFENLNVSTDYFYNQISHQDIPLRRLGYEDIIANLPKRVTSSNKGDSGKVLLIAGSLGMGGAALICGIGALRSGAGLVKIATDLHNVSAINSCRPELMTVNLYDEESLVQAINWADVIAVGPGLGQSLEVSQVLENLKGIRKPVILDADALNFISKGYDFYLERMVITPHPGEAGRLLGISASEVNADRIKSARRLYERYGSIVLLKGAGTIVYDGKRITIITEGSPSMATGGMGDLLTGMIASLCAQGLSLSQATCVAATIHGRAGTLASKDAGVIGTLPLDLAPYIRLLVNGQESF